MATINSGSFAKALWPGVNAWYGKAYKEFSPEYPALFDTFQSTRAFEEDMGMSPFGLAKKKNEANAIQYDTESQAFLTRYRHVAYALGFMVSREAYEDDMYDVIAQRRAEALAFSMRQTKEIVGANVYNRAFNSSYTGGDGKELCATDHPNYAGGTQSNEPSTASDLSEAALEQAVIDIGKWEDDRGKRIRVMPRTLIIPVDLTFEAERILETQKRVGTADNDINAIMNLGMFPGGIVVNHYLTDTDAWFIRTDVPHGMKHFERRADEFTMDNDFDTENAKFKATARYSFGWSDWRGVYGSPGAA